MQITDIQQTSADRLTVTLADGTEIKTGLGVLTEIRLSVGRDLDREELENLRVLSLRYLARDKAIEMISRRMMSKKELCSKLMQKGYDEDTAGYCVQWLSERGLINDESYAASVARHYSSRGFGPGRVRSELQRRGVDRELWDETIESMPVSDEKLDKFISAKLTDPEDRDQIRKISASLYRKGYTWEQIRSALRRHQAEVEDY